MYYLYIFVNAMHDDFLANQVFCRKAHKLSSRASVFF